MCMNEQHLHISKFFWIKLSVECICKVCCLCTVFVSKWQIETFHHGELSSCIGKTAFPDVGNTFYNVVICLSSRGKGTAREICNLYLAIRSFFNLFAKCFHYLAVLMGCREEVRKVELYLLLLCRCNVGKCNQTERHE